MDERRSDILLRAIEKAGGCNALAAKLGIASQAVSQWRKVPAGRVGRVSHITGIPIGELRPDLFPLEAAE